MNETFFFQDEKISLKIFRQDEKDCFVPVPYFSFQMPVHILAFNMELMILDF